MIKTFNYNSAGNKDILIPSEDGYLDVCSLFLSAKDYDGSSTSFLVDFQVYEKEEWKTLFFITGGHICHCFGRALPADKGDGTNARIRLVISTDSTNFVVGGSIVGEWE